MARSRPVLTLVAERALRELIQPPKDSNVLEASGVVAKGAHYYVIFDNIRRVARLHRSLEPGARKHGWVGPVREGDGYEDIAYSPQLRRFYLLVEVEKHPDGTYKAQIDECDEHGRYKRRRRVDFTFKKRNTGMEGLSAVRVQGRDYLLALCEGNGCHGGKKGKKPGSGRIHVLRRGGKTWKPLATIALPKHVKFEDYSAVAVRQQDRRGLATGLALVDWNPGGEGLENHRAGANLRLSEGQKGQAQILHPGRLVLAGCAQFRDGVGPVEG